LFERLPVFWQAAELRPHFLPFYRQLIALRRTSPALTGGDLEWLATSAPERIVAIRRRAADDEVLVVVNTSNQPWRGRVTVTGAPPWRDVTPATGPPAPGPPPAPPLAAPDTLALPAWGVRVLRRVPTGN
jgi:glycosidase